MKVAKCYNDEEMFATVSQSLTRSHFIELITIEDDTKRQFRKAKSFYSYC